MSGHTGRRAGGRAGYARTAGREGGRITGVRPARTDYKEVTVRFLVGEANERERDRQTESEQERERGGGGRLAFHPIEQSKEPSKQLW